MEQRGEHMGHIHFFKTLHQKIQHDSIVENSPKLSERDNNI